MIPPTLVLNMACRALERGDVESAQEAVRAVIALAHVPAVADHTPAKESMKLTKFAAMIDCSPRHAHSLLVRGHIVSIGSGRGLRVLVGESLTRLRSATATRTEDEGVAYVRARSRLKALPGGAQ